MMLLLSSPRQQTKPLRSPFPPLAHKAPQHYLQQVATLYKRIHLDALAQRPSADLELGTYSCFAVTLQVLPTRGYHLTTIRSFMIQTSFHTVYDSSSANKSRPRRSEEKNYANLYTNPHAFQSASTPHVKKKQVALTYFEHVNN